jgi:hypothetical protein
MPYCPDLAALSSMARLGVTQGTPSPIPVPSRRVGKRGIPPRFPIKKRGRPGGIRELWPLSLRQTHAQLTLQEDGPPAGLRVRLPSAVLSFSRNRPAQIRQSSGRHHRHTHGNGRERHGRPGAPCWGVLDRSRLPHPAQGSLREVAWRLGSSIAKSASPSLLSWVAVPPAARRCRICRAWPSRGPPCFESGPLWRGPAFARRPRQGPWAIQGKSTLIAAATGAGCGACRGSIVSQGCPGPAGGGARAVRIVLCAGAALALSVRVPLSVGLRSL